MKLARHRFLARPVVGLLDAQQEAWPRTADTAPSILGRARSAWLRFQLQATLAGHYWAWRTLIARQSSAISSGWHNTAPGETTFLSRNSGCALITITGA